MKQLEQFLLDVGRIADALEVIAAAKSGQDAPRHDRSQAGAGAAPATKDRAKDKDKAAKPKDDGDPLGEGGAKKSKFTREDVVGKLKALIAQDGKAAAFAVLADKGGGAKNATELKEEFFEDVYTECVEKLG